MQRNEEATYAEFERLKRELIEPSLSRHEGRLIKTTGDGRGALAEFASPCVAVRCAVERQDHLASSSSPLGLRAGSTGRFVAIRTCPHKRDRTAAQSRAEVGRFGAPEEIRTPDPQIRRLWRVT